MADEKDALSEKNAGKNIDRAESSNQVYRVGVKLPPFWPQEPEVWFAQIEGQFVLSGVTKDETKFFHVISNLEPKYAAEVKDIIVKPPPENKYETLKTELSRRVTISKEKKLRQLAAGEQI